MKEILEKLVDGKLSVDEAENLIKAENILEFDNIAKLDIFDTYNYRVGIGEGRYSYATAIGLFSLSSWKSCGLAQVSALSMET